MRTTASLIFIALLTAAPACEKPTEQAPSAEPDKPAPKSDDGADAPGPDAETIDCGGIAGLTCPEGMICVDNPQDGCDPKTGGRDCMGMCVRGGDQGSCNFDADPNKRYVGKSPDDCARMRFTCEDGEAYFADDCGCGCAKSG